MEYHNPENLEEFIKEFKEIYLEIDMNKKVAGEELQETKKTSSASWRSTTGIQRELIPN